MRRQKTRRYDTIFEGNTYKSWKNSFITQILLNALFCGSFTVAVAASGQSLNRVQNNTRFHFTFIEWFLFWLILPVFNWIFLLYCFYLNFLLLLPDTSHRRHTLTHFDFSPERWRMTLHNEIVREWESIFSSCGVIVTFSFGDFFRHTYTLFYIFLLTHFQDEFLVLATIFIHIFHNIYICLNLSLLLFILTRTLTKNYIHNILHFFLLNVKHLWNPLKKKMS